RQADGSSGSDEASEAMRMASVAFGGPPRPRGRQQALDLGIFTDQAAKGCLDDLEPLDAVTIRNGTTLLMRCNGMREPEARAFIMRLLKTWSAGYVATVIDDTIRSKHTIADPRSWIRSRLNRFETREQEEARLKAERMNGQKTPRPP